MLLVSYGGGGDGRGRGDLLMCWVIDVLKADGVVLLSRYDPDLMYLGHKDFIPVWDELNRREGRFQTT